MLISGFTMVRNADKLYFPVAASIHSALPIVDEFIVALGKGDADDKTRQLIEAINSPKIKIVDREWDPKLFHDGKIFAHETSFALNQCKGTWCIYLQADEVLHENDLTAIKTACEKFEHDKEVEGMLLNFIHFWGDYNHYVNSHGVYRKEIRIVRNGIGCYSYKDAVSFRKGNDEKLKVINIDARIYHYGHVRPPAIMGAKKKVQDDIHQGKDDAQQIEKTSGYEWGPIGGLELFKGTHPQVMQEWIQKFNWSNALNYSKPSLFEHTIHKHLKPKYRFMTWLEKTFNSNEEIFGLKNYRLHERK